ncbi:hypothetical protein SAY87_018763 [Trapa incisa]|uniref:Uncharacterized protein n=1 Tax=Trapa incisa TaxID=236973 RepID=A0AAN7K3F0_9MYRT|nr:hypothetical protein SAY87_018763 [Trapa incisa]
MVRLGGKGPEFLIPANVLVSQCPLPYWLGSELYSAPIVISSKMVSKSFTSPWKWNLEDEEEEGGGSGGNPSFSGLPSAAETIKKAINRKETAAEFAMLTGNS